MRLIFLQQLPLTSPLPAIPLWEPEVLMVEELWL